MLGMLSLGAVADRVGRRAGSLATAAFMLTGGVLLTCSAGPSPAAWALMFSLAQVLAHSGRPPPLCRPSLAPVGAGCPLGAASHACRRFRFNPADATFARTWLGGQLHRRVRSARTCG
jgi:MFS family permease